MGWRSIVVTLFVVVLGCLAGPRDCMLQDLVRYSTEGGRRGLGRGGGLGVRARVVRQKDLASLRTRRCYSSQQTTDNKDDHECRSYGNYFQWSSKPHLASASREHPIATLARSLNLPPVIKQQLLGSSDVALEAYVRWLHSTFSADSSSMPLLLELAARLAALGPLTGTVAENEGHIEAVLEACQTDGVFLGCLYSDSDVVRIAALQLRAILQGKEAQCSNMEDVLTRLAFMASEKPRSLFGLVEHLPMDVMRSSLVFVAHVPMVDLVTVFKAFALRNSASFKNLTYALPAVFTMLFHDPAAPHSTHSLAKLAIWHDIPAVDRLHNYVIYRIFLGDAFPLSPARLSELGLQLAKLAPAQQYLLYRLFPTLYATQPRLLVALIRRLLLDELFVQIHAGCYPGFFQETYMRSMVKAKKWRAEHAGSKDLVVSNVTLPVFLAAIDFASEKDSVLNQYKLALHRYLRFLLLDVNLQGHLCFGDVFSDE